MVLSGHMLLGQKDIDIDNLQNIQEDSDGITSMFKIFCSLVQKLYTESSRRLSFAKTSCLLKLSHLSTGFSWKAKLDTFTDVQLIREYV